MILSFIEDGTIETHDTAGLATIAYEGVDVESEMATLYYEFDYYLRCSRSVAVMSGCVAPHKELPKRIRSTRCT